MPEISEINVPDFHISEKGEWCAENKKLPVTGCFQEIQRRYKQFVILSQPPRKQSKETPGCRDLNYVYVDIWEDVAHSSGRFRYMPEPEIISHIYRSHRRELVGLMSFYPYEWPYRTEESFRDVCGENVAIDTDDLILVNQNMCVVFGTYGLRGKNAPTDWKEHLEERDYYHVSWPEYLLMLEMVLAKKYTIGAVSEQYLSRSRQVSSLKSTRRQIEQNGREGLTATGILLQLDAVKYSRYISHKIMFERTTARLEVEQKLRELDETMARIDKSLVNISEMRKLQQSVLLNVVLGVISAASLFGILFERVELPFLEHIGFAEYAGKAGVTIITFTLVLIFLCAVGMILFSLKNNRIKNH